MTPVMGRNFDLNIERVLEHWTPAHAVRELIANALDEAALSESPEPQITKDADGAWHIRDLGRGLRYEHLTQKENREKLQRPDLVGKFGVGLKDALATFDRRKVGVVIDSRHHRMTLKRTGKHGFDNLKTLHVLVDAPKGPDFVGTDICLMGIADADIATAKGMFLKYAGDEVLERTALGAVLRRNPQEPARIYVNGLRVAEEERFLFSYDVTSLTAVLRRSLNRERTNVGRTAYTDRVKAILLAASSPEVASALAADLGGFASGRLHDETSWLDVSLHACRILNAAESVIFLTAQDIAMAPALVSRAKADGRRVVTVPDDLRRKLGGVTDMTGQPMVDLNRYAEQWNDSFVFAFVDEEKLTAKERAVLNRTDEIIALQGKRPRALNQVRVSETMRINATGSGEVLGIWDPKTGDIVIRRDQLRDLARYAGALLHEVTHAASGTLDMTAAFENALTETVATVAHGSLITKTGEAERTARPLRPRRTSKS